MEGRLVKLPVFDVLGRAFAAPFKFAWPLLPFYIVSAAIGLSLFSLVAPPGAFLGTEEMVPVEGTSGYTLFGVAVLVYLIFTSTAVLTHRVVADVDHKWRLAWPVVRYFLIAIGLLLIGLAYMLLCFFFLWATVGFEKGFEMDATNLDPGMGVAVAVFSLVGIVIGSRLFLALPAAALQRPDSIFLAWEVSKGSTLRLLVAWLLYFFLVIIIGLVVGFVVGGSEILMENSEQAGGAGDGAAGGFLGAMSAGWLIANVLSNYFLTVVGAAFLTYSLIALLPNAKASPQVKAEAAD